MSEGEGLGVASLLTTAFFLAAPTASAQISCADGRTLTVQAYVKGRGTPLPRAEIRIGDQVAHTGSDGAAALCVPAGTAGSLAVTRSGYDPLTVDLTTADTLTVYLLPRVDAPEDAPTIDVIGRRRHGGDTSVGISADEAVLISPMGGDPAQVIRTLPGTQTYGFRPEVVMRGSPPGDSRYYIDDLEVPFAFHRIGLVSVLHDRALDDVELHVGAFGAQFGHATGGVVVLESRRDPPAEPLTEVRVNLPAGAAIYHERPAGQDAGVRVALRRSYLDAFLPRLAREEAGLTLVPYSGDLYASYSRTRDDGDDHVTLLGSYDGLQLAFPNAAAKAIGEDVDFDIYTAFGLIGWERRLRTRGRWSARVAPQAAYVRNRSRLLQNTIDFDRHLLRLPIEVSRSLDAEGRRLRIGVETRHLVHQLKHEIRDPGSGSAQAAVLELPGGGSLRETIPETTLDAWAAADIAVAGTTVTPGARLAHAAPLGATTLDPRLAVSVPIGAGQELTAAAGRYSQSPEPEQSSERHGNPDLGFERSVQYAVGWMAQWSAAWVTSLQLYSKAGDRLPVPDLARRYADSGELRSRGIEVFVRRLPVDRVFGWLSYTYSRTEERDGERASWHPSRFDQTHVASLTLGGRLSRVWQAGARLAYHTGDPFDAVSAPVYDPTTDRYAPLVRDEDRNGRRLPEFHQADLALMRDVAFDTWTLRWKLGVEFLSRKPQAIAARYNSDYTDVDYFVGPPPIPYVELRGVL